jgi:hypothetical protein
MLCHVETLMCLKNTKMLPLDVDLFRKLVALLGSRFYGGSSTVGAGDPI